MTWVRLDDQFFMHPKVLPLSRGAKLLYLSGLTFASAQLTDGHLTPAAVGAVARAVGVHVRLAADLVAAGLWVQTEDGYVIHDYLAYNSSRAQVERARKATAGRVARWRERHSPANGVSNTGVTPATYTYTSHDTLPVSPDRGDTERKTPSVGGVRTRADFAADFAAKRALQKRLAE